MINLKMCKHFYGIVADWDCKLLHHHFSGKKFKDKRYNGLRPHRSLEFIKYYLCITWFRQSRFISHKKLVAVLDDFQNAFLAIGRVDNTETDNCIYVCLNPHCRIWGRPRTAAAHESASTSPRLHDLGPTNNLCSSFAAALAMVIGAAFQVSISRLHLRTRLDFWRSNPFQGCDHL